MMGNKNAGNGSGFTLVEMMMVIAVFAIMVAVAIPTFMSLLPGMRLNGAARQVMGDLMAARMKAVNLNQSTKVFFDDTHSYRICNDVDTDTNKTVEDGEGDVEPRDIHPEYPDVILTFTSASNPAFSPRGTATNHTITLGNSSGSKSITISIAGRVMIN